MIQDYFDVLESTTEKTKLHDKSHLIFNYDESAKIVLVPTSMEDEALSFYCHRKFATCASVRPRLGRTVCLPLRIVFSKEFSTKYAIHAMIKVHMMKRAAGIFKVFNITYNTAGMLKHKCCLLLCLN